MAADLKKVSEQTRALWDRLPAGRRWVLVAVVLVCFVGLGFITFSGGTSHAVLFSGLAPEDAGQIVAYLDASKVPYRLENNGTTITVPEGDVHRLRLSLASNGIPHGGGVGFEVFEKQAFGTTSFVEKMNYRRALQGELQRTIASLSVVERARVHLAIQERSLYRDEDEPPSASVVVKLRPGRTLSRGQVRGIVHLVSSSVEGLQPGRITILDDTGTVLASGDKDESESPVAQQELERTLEKRIVSILEPVVGAGHIAVTVTADIDMAHTERTEEIFDPEKISLRSEQRTVEGAGAASLSASGVAGARGNLPTSAPGADPAAAVGNGQISRLSETRNFEVNRIVSRTIGPKARIRRLHVAVLVDGVPAPKSTGAEGAADQAETNGDAVPVKPEIIPRSKEELARIELLAREAAGLDAERGDRIEVHSVPFATDPASATADDSTGGGLPFSLHHAVMLVGGLGLLVLGVLALFMLRGKQGRGLRAEIVQALPARVGDLEANLGAAAPLGAGINPTATGRMPAGLPEQSARDRALAAIRGDAERAARILAQWASEGADAGGAR